MATKTKQDKHETKLTKFPNAEKANRELPTTLPSAFSLFSPSVAVIKNNLAGFIILLGIPLVLALIGQGPELWQGVKEDTKILPDFGDPLTSVALVGGILGLLASPGLIILQLKGLRKESITWQAALAQGLEHIWRFIGLAILTALILGVAALLFIVPFFIVLPRIFLAAYYLIDRKAGVIESLKLSNDDYKERKGIWGVIGVFVLMALANLVPGVGWIISNVLAFMYTPAPALRYEQINLITKGEAPQTPIEAELTASAA